MIRSIAIAALLVVLAVSPVAAVDVELNAGRISMSTTTPAPFNDVFIDLFGPEFSLSNSENFRISSFTGSGSFSENPYINVVPVGGRVDFAGRAVLFGVVDDLVYQGVHYRGVGHLDIAVAKQIVADFVTAPFTVTGNLQGLAQLDDTVLIDVTVRGGGTMNADFHVFDFPVTDDGFAAELRDIAFIVTPEPSVWLTVGAVALVGLAFAPWFVRPKRSFRRR